MISGRIAIALAAASLGFPAGPAFAQAPDAPTPAAPAAHRGATPKAAKTDDANPKKTHAKKASKPAAAPVRGDETEASSLERRRRAFFGAKPDEAAPDQDTPSAGVTLGGSGGISPGMGFKF